LAEASARFQLTVEDKHIEAKAAEMAVLLDLNRQLEAIGHQFARIERLQ
jgi:hypothetical protein